MPAQALEPKNMILDQGNMILVHTPIARAAETLHVSRHARIEAGYGDAPEHGKNPPGPRRFLNGPEMDPSRISCNAFCGEAPSRVHLGGFDRVLLDAIVKRSEE